MHASFVIQILLGFFNNLNEMYRQVSDVRHLVDAQFFIEAGVHLKLNPLTGEQHFDMPQNLSKFTI